MMNHYLCTSIIIIVITLMVVINDFGSSVDDEYGNIILTTQQLRSMHVIDIVDENYKRIYNGIVGTAINGKTTIYFTIMCVKSPEPSSNSKYNYGDDNTYNCDNYNGYLEWLKRKYGEHVQKNIQPKQIQNRVIKKLQTAFPDSNITKSYTNCCDQYRINW